MSKYSSELRERTLRSLSLVHDERHAISSSLQVIHSELSRLRTRAPEVAEGIALETHERVIALQALIAVMEATWQVVNSKLHETLNGIETNIPKEKEQ